MKTQRLPGVLPPIILKLKTIEREYNMKKTKLEVAISVASAVTVTLMAAASWYGVFKKD